MFARLMLLGWTVSLACYAAPASADVAAGKLVADKDCGACHEPADWKGQNAVQLEAKIHSVVAGKSKHPKKIGLTDAQISDLAAYWAAKPG
ncbi:MAG: hypothetical protein WDO56_19405 [Gammaproteobacteria bacterium]